uniref:Uncharacterized protein n=1 Tax=Caenorhabditis tropicalis TaxID=1561998 RepID=A0A1I7TLK1_9PELO
MKIIVAFRSAPDFPMARRLDLFMKECIITFNSHSYFFRPSLASSSRRVSKCKFFIVLLVPNILVAYNLVEKDENTSE